MKLKSTGQNAVPTGKVKIHNDIKYIEVELPTPRKNQFIQTHRQFVAEHRLLSD